ncbi:DUF1002 domain-containing protein [Clostridium luticellarii]|jgi:uncharacterized protein YpuA (DUF1002 family)|uniref:DUF1002 domain-containing protein n=1 Tax=Clostridium luticellarii TaxID=1691940 RepID=A0A2T0BN07_9CLOT|nr:DUF1002 domain-containing protein [Clostridium luticellarii]MCI1944012.1 DUF1002 domain-containing protein [Clostridium luticellarii]MCI1967346.1 DUF1002 domain-containing protein [Clostridium luticellarii]MCI1995537.1 DUF1002 domain-containing protein [Clostridium luticellarii]MCI2039168.1 DUF1002 domain-containing protein [Clostridium luticellarii]PRR85202.1 hypothetical protein CLLU_18460 [Clostridium luticellarii]
MKIKTIFSKFVIALMVLTLTASFGSVRVYADAYKVVTLGGDLTGEQKEDMLKYFGVTRQDANIIEVNIDEERKYLGNVATSEQIGTKSISSSYVEPTSSGGLNVSTNNIYWVSSSMIKNALITAGIKNANVKVSAPFNVSGTAALTGILKGFENSSSGNKIDEAKKQAANDELMTTGNLGDKIGKDKAAGLINDIKTQVVKDKPKTDEEVRQIVENVTNNYNLNLSTGDIDKITALMTKINGLNLNFGDIKGQLSSVADQLKGSLSSAETQNFFQKIINAVKQFFSNLF